MPSNGAVENLGESFFFSGALETKDGGVATGNIGQDAISKANAGIWHITAHIHTFCHPLPHRTCFDIHSMAI